MVSHLRKYNYEERLKRLGIPSLRLRKARGHMIAIDYNTLIGKEKINSQQFFKMWENVHDLQGRFNNQNQT